MNNIITLEEELYAPVRDYLKSLGFEVKAEVNHCDCVAVKNGNILVVELKRGLTIELLIQAVKRQKIADSVFVAVPKPKINTFSKKWKDICNLLRRLELGLMLVSKKDGKYSVEVVIEPLPFDFRKSRYAAKKKRVMLMGEFNGRTSDKNTGGCRGKKIMTAYKEQASKIAEYIIKNGPASAKKLSASGFEHKKAYSILYKNYYGWFKKEGKGIYSITDKCLKEISLLHSDIKSK